MRIARSATAWWRAIASALLLGTPSAAAQTHPETIPADVRWYDARFAMDVPTIDGRLDDRAWSAAPWTEAFLDIEGPERPEPTWRTRAKMVWDSVYLYVAAELEEPHLWSTLTERDAIIYQDHDFEVFLDPDGDRLEYYELEINALGTEFDLFLPRPYSEGGRANIPWDMPGLITAVHLDGSLNDATDVDVGWSVEIAIPWADLIPPPSDSASDDDAPAPLSVTSYQPGEAPEAGDLWRVNFSRVQWPLERVERGYRRRAVATPEEPHPEDNWVWSPQGEINMHIPERWGVVRFVGASGESR